MTYWVGGDWLYHTNPKLSGRFYIGADGGIYEQTGDPTGYSVETRVYIVGPRGEFPVDANGNISGDPFEEFADAAAD
jgi:hypothetical protein